MRAYLVTAPHRGSLTELATPEPGPGEVLVAPAAVGICGSDIELRDGRRPAGYVRYPVVPGHEWAGHVVAVGAGVSRLAGLAGLEPGVPVVAEGVRTCGTCARCAEGRNNLCTGPYAETGFTHPGALAERLVVPATLLHPLPADRPIAAAALIEPAACVATGLLEVGYPAPGSRVAVVGDGPLGLLAVALLRLASTRELVLFGSRPERSAYARQLGATDVVLRAEPHPGRPGGTGPPRLGGTGPPGGPGGGFDLVLEATNSAAGAATALGLARRAGTVVLLGISGAAGPTLYPDVITLNHLRVQGVFAASRVAWRWLVSLYTAGLFDAADMITHRFGLHQVDEAFAVLADRSAGALKVVVEPAA
ncbi:MAG TPA: alcohol dehydrogenase catalytic domain-containing protein [Mycobacteriales bacterium]|nr:alcohol dehydrogenase catalytic domain-containing protein [Mycobacteriales bacterium]